MAWQSERPEPLPDPGLRSGSTVTKSSVTPPNLLQDPRFIREIREDGRFVEVLQQFGLNSGEPAA
jgi:hypothetical protein